MDFTYRYFKAPHAFSYYSEEPKECGICHHSLPGYEGPFYGPIDLDFVCEPCLHSGALASVGCSTNEGRVADLRAGLSSTLSPHSPDDVRRIAQERTAELEQRTPHHVSWQDQFWPVHCSDYCRFEKEAGQADFAALARGGSAKHFFLEHLSPDHRGTDLEQLWLSIRPDSPSDQSEAFDIGVYLYSCLVCGQHVITWDAS